MHGPDANDGAILSLILLGRVATYVVPSLAVVITAAVLLGPGATRKAAFVRVYGAPVVGSKVLSLRIAGAERLYGIDERRVFENLEIEAHGEQQTLGPIRFSLESDGVGEVHLDAAQPLIGPFDVRVTQGQTCLVEGRVNLAPQTIDATLLTPRDLAGTTSGNVRIFVSVVRGILAAPFRDLINVRVGLAEHVSPNKNGVGEVKLRVSAPGAIVKPEEFVLSDDHFMTLEVTPQAHHVLLSIDATSEAYGASHWESVLPIVPGAMWLGPSSTEGYDILSPVPRDHAYVSFMGPHGRTFGKVLSFVQDKQGTYRAYLGWEEDRWKDATQLVVSGDPEEQGPATVAWPFGGGQKIVAVPTIQQLLDGAHAAEERERERARRARRVGLLVVITTTIFEVLYMLMKSRQSQKRFEKSLEGFVENEQSPEQMASADILATARQENPVLRVALTIALVCVAFSMIAALSTLQW